jgi:hypothetical protein
MNNYWTTLDGHKITDGLRVWDYDLRPAIVDVKGTSWADPKNEFHKYWNGWFEMKTPDGNRSSTMNGERMWVRHPYTGAKA